MKSKLILIITICILVVLSSGCGSSEKKPYWTESENRFYTKDLSKAQNEIPFPILLPTYLPRNHILPDIEGPLSQFQTDNNTKVTIVYGIDIGKKYPGVVLIDESNYALSLGEPELNPELERKEIEGLSVVKTKDDWGSGITAYYSFNSKSIYYNVETHDIPNKEAYKIVESMIKQLK